MLFLEAGLQILEIYCNADLRCIFTLFSNHISGRTKSARKKA